MRCKNANVDNNKPRTRPEKRLKITNIIGQPIVVQNTQKVNKLQSKNYPLNEYLLQRLSPSFFTKPIFTNSMSSR